MTIEKRSFPLVDIRQHLETGPIVLVSSHWQGLTNIMTMGWHTMLQFSPALIGCYIWEGNRSHEMIRRSGECVINIPTVDLVNKVIQIGNRHGEDGDKFAASGLTASPAAMVAAPLIDECYASLECRLHDDRMVDDYSFFIWEVVRAHVADIGSPRTLHYRGQARFMVAGEELAFPDEFKPQNL